MRSNQKEVFIGLLVAIFTLFSGMYLYIELFSQYDFVATFKMIEDGDLYGQIIALGAVPNLFVFFIYLKKKQEARAKGVLIATILIALITVYTKFI